MVLEVFAPDGIGEVAPGTDLAGLVAEHVPDLADGDVVVITSKIVSKAEGRARSGTREEALPAETVRVVARRGPLRIVLNHLGVIQAAAGIDASNVEPGTVLLLPLDPDATARTLRDRLYAATGRNVAVLVSDTAGRAWRHGQTDLALGAAGIAVLDDHAGRVDGYGNPLAVTAPAVADEIASAAELVAGKLSGRPVTVLRGLADRVLRAGEHGPGASTLVRSAADDLFGLGAREAVLAALAEEHHEAFGTPADLAEVLEALDRIGIPGTPGPDGRSVRLADSDADPDDPGSRRARLAAAAYALGWVVRHRRGGLVLVPRPVTGTP